RSPGGWRWRVPGRWRGRGRRVVSRRLRAALILAIEHVVVDLDGVAAEAFGQLLDGHAAVAILVQQAGGFGSARQLVQGNEAVAVLVIAACLVVSKVI